jgi:hypothetical protein
MEFTVNVTAPTDMYGRTVEIGDYVDHCGEVYRVDGFDVTCDMFGDGDIVTGVVEQFYFTNRGFAEPSECVKFVPSQMQRIKVALDSELTDGEALDEVLNIIGYKR